MLDGFFITDIANKYRDQQIEITVYVPEGTVIYNEENTGSYFSYNSDFKELNNWDNEAHHFLIQKNKVECLDCPEEWETLEETDTMEVKITQKIDTVNSQNRKWEEKVNENFEK